MSELKENKKKIMIVLGSMGRGGAERVISNIANYLSERGWIIKIVLLLFYKVDYDLNPNIEILDLTDETKGRISKVPMWINGLKKEISSFNPDVILSFAARINILVLFANLKYKKRVVISERNDPYMDGRSVFVDILTKVLYKTADTVVFQTNRAKSYFKKFNLNKQVIIPNPISVECDRSNSIRGKIVSVGRLTSQKNHELLLDAFIELRKKYDYLELWIYGEGELRELLEQRAKKAGVDKFVHLPGIVQDVHNKIKDAQVFVLSSNYEGLSNALLEALMMGLPCVSTRCAGADEYIEDSNNGMLINIGDKEGMILAMTKILDSEKFAERLSVNAKKMSENFAKDTVLKKWEEILY